MAAASGPTVAAGTVRAWVDLAAAKGVRRSALLERSQLDPHALEDQDQRIPLAKLVTLIRAAKELCGDPALALHFGETIDCADYSVASMISYACATVADALAQRNRYGRLMADVECDRPDRYLLERAQGSVWLIDTRRQPNEIPELTEAFFARVASASTNSARRRSCRRLTSPTRSRRIAPSTTGSFECPWCSGATGTRS